MTFPLKRNGCINGTIRISIKCYFCSVIVGVSVFSASGDEEDANANVDADDQATLLNNGCWMRRWTW